MEKKQEDLKKQNAQLVKELAAKNHELQIEAALEKVRTRALAMQQPDDMLDICRTICEQLELLGVAEIRNVQTAITYESRGIYMNYEYYRLYQKTFITEVDYSHPIQANFVKQMLVEGAYQALTLDKKELANWFEYQKTTNQFVDPHLAEAESLNYHWFSIGTVALGISLYKQISKEGLELFKRFLDVFRLAYRRYKDVELAIEQAHEVQIELSLERVRSVAMSMNTPGELLSICGSMFKELQSLEFGDLRNVIIHTYAERDYFIDYDYSDFTKGHISHIPYFGNSITKKFVHDIRKTKDAFTEIIITGKKLKEWQNFRDANKEAPDERLNNTPALYYYIYSVGDASIGISTFNPIPPDKLKVLKRFRNIFDLAYRRYKDVELALEQAREAQIELSLERVRAVAMAMNRPEEMLAVCEITHKELLSLGFTNIRNAQISIINELKGRQIAFEYSDRGSIRGTDTPISSHPLLVEIAKAIKISKDALFQKILSGEEFIKWREWRHNIVPTDEPRLMEASSISFYLYSTGYGILGISSYGEITTSQLEILKRFKKVFELGYTRYADVAKAEADAKEANIEAALERVRSRSMGMQKSDELKEVIQIIYDQFIHLNIGIEHTGFVVDYQPGGDWHFWIADKVGSPAQLTVADYDCAWNNSFNEAKKKGADFFAINLNFEEKNKFYSDLFANATGEIPEHGKQLIFSKPGLAISTVLLADVALYIENFAGVPYTDEENAVLMRFGNVFQQTYTRFLDLQKAEAQAREGQIQLALERIRARTMAMQHSDELLETSLLLSQQFYDLGTNAKQVSIGIIDEQRGMVELSATLRGVPLPRVFDVRIDQPMMVQPTYNAWKRGERMLEIIIEGEQLREYNKLRSSESGGRYDFEDKGQEAQWIVNLVFFSQGFLACSTDIPITSETRQLLERFGGVFEQTYTRFLDLKTAEAQSREGQIQLALERVRARTMAMQRSEELSETVFILFQQFKELGESPDQATIGIINEAEWTIEYWVTMHGNQTNKVFKFSIDEPNVTRKIYDGWKAHDRSLVIELSGKELFDFSTYRAGMGGAGYNEAEKLRVINVAFFSKGLINVQSTSARSPESILLLERFAGVFEQTYTRFLDLQKAEAQAKEAQIEAGLERVRSRTMAMQSSDELAETAAVVFKQLIGLGIEPNRLFIGIIKDESGDMEFWATDEDGSRISTRFIGNKEGNRSIKKMYMGWKDGKSYITIDMKGNELQDYFHYLKDELHVPFKLGLSQKRRVQNIAYFSQGFIGMASPDMQPVATTSLLERFAGVFNLTYTRFNDLKIAEAHALQSAQDLVEIKIAREKAEAALSDLKAAQTKLIQTEKMASLGELTAGIAHEIQNPLNFVNNFSEVNTELIDELQLAIENKDLDEIKAIAIDIKENETKINMHGKRADGIVKGMLQHSKIGSGTKELTDINTLADEFMRLAYHGLRAKDKSFNAELVTNFDPQLPKVIISQQDIGRVLLNMFNNAFYAVNQKQKTAGDDYKPTVTVSTSTEKSNLIIKVKDNGNGIPQNIVDKIYQPFFTTKPTGEGTGLGLSLSYDIVVKGHGGSITVNTKEGEFTEFTVILPINS